MGKKEFAAVVLNSEHKIYVVHIGSFSFLTLPSFFLLEFDVYTFRRPQIFSLIVKKALTKVSAKYLDFVDVFSLDLVSELHEHIEINNHTIKLVDCQ